MSALVKEYFPDAPEKCLNCPGLLAAAKRLDADFGLATGFATSEENPDNPVGDTEHNVGRRAELTQALSKGLTDRAVHDISATSPIACDLVKDCEGPLETTSLFHKKRVGITRCGSPSPQAKFIPDVMS